MNRREFLALMTAAAAIRDTGAWAAGDRPPNIILILADDLGWADIGCNGSTFYETPNLDRLAGQGVRFTNAYAACPVCSPTRASIMTGQYPARLHLTNFLKGVLSPEDAPIRTAVYADQLPLEEVTLAEALKTAGYATAHIGKWHLGGDAYGPDKQGFDHSVVTKGGGPYSWPAWQKKMPHIKGDYDGQYISDRMAREACAFIDAHRDAPFFINLCHDLVHIPIQPPEALLAKYQEKLKSHPPAPGTQSNPHYAAMVEAMDQSIGVVMDAIEKAGLADDTLILFTSDNGGLSVVEGPLTPATTNAPFRAGKGYLYEGGIRVPLVVRWPGHTTEGAVCNATVCSIDHFPTLCAAAGASMPAKPVDGVDIGALFEKPHGSTSRQALYWHYPHFANQGGRPSGAILEGAWKLIEFYEDGRLELYNIEQDPGEQHDRAQEEPERVKQLHAALIAWRESVDATMPERK